MAAVPVRPAIEALRCSEERDAKSIEGKDATTLLFQNNRGSTVRIYWLDYQGQRKFYAELPPGRQQVMRTYMTHPWIVTDETERCFAFYMPERTQRRVDIR
jgi:von Hippel-Lindau disease tumor supressor